MRELSAVKRLGPAAAVVLAMCGTVQADQQNVYDFAFTGTYYPDTPFPPTSPVNPMTSVDFTVTFLANSPTLPFPPNGAFFGASVNAYDIRVIVNNNIVQQGGTGTFGFNGSQIGGYPNGLWIGGDWGFDSASFAWGGVEDFGLGNPDPLNGAAFNDELGETGCSVGGEDFLCDLEGSSLRVSASVPEPPVWTLLSAAGVGLLLFRRRRAEPT